MGDTFAYPLIGYGVESPGWSDWVLCQICVAELSKNGEIPRTAPLRPEIVTMSVLCTNCGQPAARIIPFENSSNA